MLVCSCLHRGPIGFAPVITSAGLLPNTLIVHISCFTHLLPCECPQLRTRWIHSFCFPVPNITWGFSMYISVSLFLFYDVAFTSFRCWFSACSWLLKYPVVLWEKKISPKPSCQVGQGRASLSPAAQSSLGYRAQTDPPALHKPYAKITFSLILKLSFTPRTVKSLPISQFWCWYDLSSSHWELPYPMSHLINQFLGHTGSNGQNEAVK